ncbi:MAG: hypothetical protein RLZZ127_2876, partial [Planctomycetota bacterium]
MRCVPAFLTLLALAPMAAGADTVTVRVVADPDERRPAVGGFEIIRTGSTTAAQPVSYLVLGSAAEGTDFTAIARSATIAAGATSARVAVRAIEDGVGDGVIDAAETVRIQLVPPSGMAVGSPDSATLVIADGQPALSVTALGALDEASPGASAAFRISFPGRPLPSRTITATLSYSGANGGYTAPGGVVQIPAGLTEVEVAIFPVADAVRTGDRTLTATLVAGSGYTVGSATAAMTLRDDEPVLAISGSATVAEGATCALAVSRDRALPTALVVPLTVAGSATTADRTVPASVTIAAGATSARIVVTARQDSLAESTETVVVGIVTSTAWAVAPASAAATVTILDDEPVVGFLGGDRTVAQGATTALVVARSST